jgi:type IV pilus assembly protein PilO
MAMRTGLEGKPLYYSAAVGLIVAGMIFFFGYKFQIVPLQDEIARQETRLGTLRQKIQDGRAAQRQLPKFREAVLSLELELDKLLRVLPARRNTPELLRRIRALVEQGDFGFRRFTPQNFVNKDFYSEWPIVINLTGGYHNLAQFFDRISRFSRIINIENLNISAARGASDQTIAASFTVKTFVYKELPPPAVEKNGSPAKP